MQPTSRVSLDEQSFEALKRTIKNVVVPHRERKHDPGFKTVMPEIMSLKLTNRCNLRCKHCYQWNESGYHHDMDTAEQNLDMDLGMIQRLLEETDEAQSRLYLWGGEPLFHRQAKEILDLLKEHPRDTTICTNAYMIPKFEEELCAISDNLELLIPIEGFQEEHDFLRGKNSFQKVIDAVDRLLELREQGRFRGRISVHNVINDNMIGRLYELVEFLSKKASIWSCSASHGISRKTPVLRWTASTMNTSSGWPSFRRITGAAGMRSNTISSRRISPG